MPLLSRKSITVKVFRTTLDKSNKNNLKAKANFLELQDPKKKKKNNNNNQTKIDN